MTAQGTDHEDITHLHKLPCQMDSYGLYYFIAKFHIRKYKDL